MKFSFYEGRSVYPDISFPDDLAPMFLKDIPDKSEIELLHGKKLILLHTGRCGSTLLHHLIAPHACPPIEIFNKESAGPILSAMGQVSPVNIKDYILTYQNFYAHTPFLSISITPWHLLGLYNMFPVIAEWLLKDSILVILIRRNIIKQAISYACASESAVWHSFDSDNVRELDAPDLQRIVEFIDLLVWGEISLGRDPLLNILSLARKNISISYEGIVDNKEEIALMILREMDLNISAISFFKDEKLPVKLKKSDAISNIYLNIISNFPLVLRSRFIVDENFIFSRLNESFN